MTQIHDAEWRPVRGGRLIWADRWAIAFFMLTGGLLGLAYALWGDPGTFVICEKIAGSLTAVLWFFARVLDFAATGRIRYGTV